MSTLSTKLTISVVICAYNEQDWIGKTLASLMKQRRLPDEVVVVDNVSTDSTSALVERFIHENPNRGIKIVTESRKGLHYARDTGWRAATSDVIVTTDADITFPAEWLEIVERHMSDPDVDAITGIFRYTDALPAANWVTQMGETQRVKNDYTHLNGGNSAVRRHILEEVDGYVGKPPVEFEDQYLSKKIEAAGYKIRYATDLLVWHTFRRFNKEGIWGYIRYIFFYKGEDIYPDHLSDDSPYSVSIVVPATNAEWSIQRCLESLVKQQPRPHEIVVVDNGSTDGTIQCVETFIAAHPSANIRLVSEMRCGLQYAWETGWRAATSDIIVQVNADEVFPDDWLAKIHTVFMCNPEVSAVGGEIRVEPSSPARWLAQGVHNLRMRWRSKTSVYLPEGMTAYKRETLEKLNAEQSQNGTRPLSVEIEKLGYKLHFKPDIYALRRVG
jgi:glycosyltransferase involved in cell wall biosynthesis